MRAAIDNVVVGVTAARELRSEAHRPASSQRASHSSESPFCWIGLMRARGSGCIASSCAPPGRLGGAPSATVASGATGVRTEGVEPSWPKPPVSETGASTEFRHIRRVGAAGVNLAGGSRPVGSRGRSGTRPLEPFLLEARLATRLELDHLCRTRRLEVGRRNPNDVQVHSSLLSLCEGRLTAPSTQRAPEAKSEMSCGVAVSKPTTSSIPASLGSAISCTDLLLGSFS